ncbi:MAG: DNA methyltransferase, partial [Polyangiaceae bacterium]
MLTPEAKNLLAETIRGTAQAPERGLRARLLRVIHDEADRRYRLSVDPAEAGLDEAHERRRERIEAWLDERARATKPKNKAEIEATKDRLLQQAEKEAAATFLNRLVLLRVLEAQGLSKPLVLTGGWSSKGHREFRELGPVLAGDDTEGYAALLQLLFDELAVDLPGLFGDVGLTRLLPIPAAMLRDAVERLDDPGLASAWTDDTTLGWVYQFWNDPEREAIDERVGPRGKIAAHEIASKTQLFTERYMVEWLLENSVGRIALAMREARAGRPASPPRAPPAWPMFVHGAAPADPSSVPARLEDLKILDPACGSGHLLAGAFDLLVPLYREEARGAGKEMTGEEIAASILLHNLHGIDIDHRAVRVAAAVLYLKARRLAPRGRIPSMNLVSTAFDLDGLSADDPALADLAMALPRARGQV